MAILWAKGFHSEIILIHVIPEIKDYPIVRNKIRKKVTEKLKQMESSLKRKGIASVETIACFGIPFERIIEHSEELDVNLIVIGSGEKEKKYPLGITAERVMFYGNKPVFVVKRSSPPTIPQRDVNLALLDGLHHYGFSGQKAVIAHSNRDVDILRESGADLILSPFADAAKEAAEMLGAEMDSKNRD